MTLLLTPYTMRDLTVRNRIVMPPMCMYCAGEDGRATDWHVTHYASRAVGGAGLIITEATAVQPRGRISAQDLGLWDDGQVEPLSRIAGLCRAEGAAFAVQLAHAGRKAWSSTYGVGPEAPVGPSPLPQGPEWVTPQALSLDEIDALVEDWRRAAARADAAGCDAIEIHGAHGYLLHSFLSPLSNQRDDAYGGSLENRSRLLLRVVDAARAVWPERKPLFVRLSCVDWRSGGLDIEDTIAVARALAARGVDVVHCSSGGIAAPPSEALTPGYQVPFSEAVRRAAKVATIAVGLLTRPEQANEVLRLGQADLVALGRELLRSPYWPLHAAHSLGADVTWPTQYLRARPSLSAR